MSRDITLLRNLVYLSSAAGLVADIYQYLSIYYSNLCDINCLTILSSYYSRLLGVPLGIWAAAYFITVALYIKLTYKRYIPIALISIVSSLYAIYLLHIMLNILAIVCIPCIIQNISIHVNTISISTLAYIDR